MEKKRLVLVYPAYATPTSPPLGVCYLKGFIERTLPEWSVKVLDLNLSAYDGLFREIGRRACLSGAGFPEGLLGEIALSRAAEVFRGQHPDEFYRRGDRYSVYATLWLRFISSETNSAQLLEQMYYQNQPLPPAIAQFVEQIMAEQPDAVGFSLCYSRQVWLGFTLAKAVKQRAQIPVVMGGTFFNSEVNAAWAIQRGNVDCIVGGEAERALAQLLGAGMDPTNVPGATWLQDGKPAHTPAACEEHLDLLGEPDFSDLDLNAYYCPRPVLPVLTSRGCYWRRCAFCVHYRSAGMTYRRRSIPQVIDELKRHMARGVQHFSIIDEMISPPQFAQLADAIIAAGLDIAYYAMAKPVKQFDRELLGKIRRSGCRYLLWGVESGSQRLLDLMDKGTNLPDVEAVLQTAREVGLRNHVYVMAGFPTETRAELQATLALLNRHKADIAAVHRGPYVLERDSPVFDNPQKFGITRMWPAGELPSACWYQFECSSGMTSLEAQQLLGEALPYLRSFSEFSTHLSNFRDHALLIYAHEDQ